MPWSGRWWPLAPATTSSRLLATWRRLGIKRSCDGRECEYPYLERACAEQARCPGTHCWPDLPARLQHRVALSLSHRVTGDVADDPPGECGGRRTGADHEATEQVD